MTIQITENIWQFTHGGNIFLVRLNDNELMLIDAGIPGSTSSIMKEIRELGFEANQVEHILVTHADPDHAGSLHGVKNATGAKLYASKLSAPFIESAKMADHVPFFVKFVAGLYQNMMQKPVLVDVRLEDGQVLEFGGGIRVIHIPGHTEENFAYLWEAENAIFLADLLDRRGGELGLMPGLITWDSDKARESTLKVLDLEPDVICVGHGKSLVVAESPQEIVNLRKSLTR